MEWRSEKRKREGQKILVDVVEAEIVRRDIYRFGRGRDGLLLAFCLLQWFGSIHLVYSIRRRYNGIPQNGDNDNQMRSRALWLSVGRSP